MLTTPDIAVLFPSLGKHDERYSWSLFEVGTQPHGCMIAIGTRELGGGDSRRLDVLALDLTERGWHSRQVMTSAAYLDSSGVKVTSGMVEVERARLRGQGVGSLVFNVVTAWAQRTFPGRTVQPITIVRPANGTHFDRLTRFYGRFGFQWDRPADGWYDSFPSKPMMVDALQQYPEELLPVVRHIDLTASITAMLKRIQDADDDRRTVAVLRCQLANRRDRWRTIGYRLNWFALALAALVGFGTARALALL